MQSKMTLPVDSDILRMKVMKETEGRHRIELEQKQSEVDRVSDSYYQTKRELDVVKTRIEGLQSEHEKALSDKEHRHKQEVHELMLENQALQSKADDKRDRELIRQLRREADESKRRITELLGEVSDLRRERDHYKLDKNE